MAGKEVQAVQIQRNDTAAGWAEKNPILRTGEFGVESDTGKFKIGDGVTLWNDLGFSISENAANADTLDGKHASAFAAAGHSHSYDDLTDKPTVLDGEDGATYTPSVNAAGVLSWNNDKGRDNPGPVNIKGPAGAQGPKGDKGDSGEPGPQGLKGDTGATGPAGPQGIQGPKGDKGDPGDAGPAGPQGLKGATGATGPKGDKGDTGPAGPQGLKGDTGPAGPQGIQGPKGDTGAKGATGAQGPAGPAGATPTIKAGTVTTGAAGTNAAVTAATSGTTTTFNFTIPRGTTGAAGAKGATGATGPQGPKGDKGDTGPAGPQGPSGATAAVATTSANGLMAAADKVKLNGIAASANNYTHPANHPASIITQDATHRFTTDTEKTNWNGKANASHTHSYLPLTGGTMTGNVKYTMFNSTQTPFEVYGGDANGQGIAIGAGGATIVGSGESKERVKSNLSAAGERLYLSSDNEIILGTNLQSSWESRKEVIIDASGQIYAVDGTKKVYHTGNKPTAADVGLGNVNNTADSAKNVASAAKLTTARQLNGASFNGTANVTVPLRYPLPETSIYIMGNYNSSTVTVTISRDRINQFSLLQLYISVKPSCEYFGFLPTGSVNYDTPSSGWIPIGSRLTSNYVRLWVTGDSWKFTAGTGSIVAVEVYGYK